MRIMVAALAVGLAAGTVWVSAPAQAAMPVGSFQTKPTSLVQSVVVPKEARSQMRRGKTYTCTNLGFMTCCTSAEHSFCAPHDIK